MTMAASAGQRLRVVVATTPNMGIGLGGELPWPALPLDLDMFRRLTTERPKEQEHMRNAVIMGRKTWDSIPPKHRPLKDRINFVLSTSMSDANVSADVRVVRSLEEVMKTVNGDLCNQVYRVFVVGGSYIYKLALDSGLVAAIYMTRIGSNFEADTFFPSLPSQFRMRSISKTFSHSSIPFDFVIYEPVEDMETSDNKDLGEHNLRRAVDLWLPDLRYESGTQKMRPCSGYLCNNGTVDSNASTDSTGEDCTLRSRVVSCPLVRMKQHEEFQYLDLIAEVLNDGAQQSDRTGVGVISKFGHQMRFDLRQSFPLLTTKRVFWRGVVEELLWFIRGETNGNTLASKGVKIWEKNGSHASLDALGLGHRKEGDLGPIYGFQWRHFGAEYSTMDCDYSNKGVDQLMECIHKLKSNPTDRRIILSAWNPPDLPKMALPPCHMLCQFYVADGHLSCQMYQRSCDLGLGVPFNIASYSLLTCLMAQVCDLKAGDFVHTLGNAHVYLNHVEPLKTQLTREPRPFPVLKINPTIKDIESFKFQDLELIGYNPHDKISMDMAV